MTTLAYLTNRINKGEITSAHQLRTEYPELSGALLSAIIKAIAARSGSHVGLEEFVYVVVDRGADGPVQTGETLTWDVYTNGWVSSHA